MNLSEAKALLPEIRFNVDCVGLEWLEIYDTKAGRSQIAERDGMDGQVYPLATLEKSIPTEQRELMRKAPVYIRALLLLRDEAAKRYLEVTQPEPQIQAQQGEAPKPLSSIVAIKCGKDRAFAQYLMDQHGLDDVSNAERIKSRVRSVLSIQSLKELNEDPRAIQAWRKLNDNFYAWLKVTR